jgi:signal transduction histidine kinase
MHENPLTLANSAVLLLDNGSRDEARIAAALTRAGWMGVLTRVGDRASFESALRTGTFHLILAEYSLPDFDGLAVLDLARTCCPGVPLLFVTNVRGEEVVVEALKQGASDYVLKNRLDRLGPAVQRALAEVEERTSRLEAEKATQETSRRKDAFLGMLGHELRNPLAALCNATSLWRRKTDDPAMQQWCLEVIERQVGNLMRLVDDMVDVSRVIRGLIRPTLQPTELGPLVRRVVEGHRVFAESRGLQLTFADEAPGVLIEADAPRLQRALDNLVQNAIKFSTESGQVEVAIRHSGPAVEIVVRDEGIGLTAERLPRLFELFASMDQGSTRTQNGLGVGLTVAQHLVGLHGGTLTAASAGPGCGSTFTVRLATVHASSSDE